RIPTEAYYVKNDLPIPPLGKEFFSSVDLKKPDTMVLSKKLRITPENAWLAIGAAAGDAGSGGHRLTVNVDGIRHHSFLNGDVSTEHAGAFDVQERFYGLGKYLGREVELEVLIDPVGPDDWNNHRPLLIKGIDLQSAVMGYRSGPPDVSLSSLTPLNLRLPEGESLRKGKLSSGEPLELRSLPFRDGYGVPSDSEITYTLDPSWKRFVAVVGLANRGWQAIGPFEVYLDDRPHWRSGSEPHFSRSTRLYQIDLDIPPGHKTITLKLAPGESYGGWADAGFMLTR
ncbi:MAG: NPCBM/NEW2 domain-containing protein, partial [Verrucomicrobiota bacterium]